MVNQYYASSPVLMARPQDCQPVAAVKRQIPKYPIPPSINYLALARTSNRIAGRKRSRDDDSHNVEYEVTTRATSYVENREALNTLTFPFLSSHVAQSPSGAWVKDSTATPINNINNLNISRPAIMPRKSRCQNEHFAHLSEMVQNEEIDPLARQLGIGWKRLNEVQQMAIAGSETFIRLQFDMAHLTIVLHHAGMALYLVKSEPRGTQGDWSNWWLFGEELRSCRFLCNDDTQLIPRLNHKRQDASGQWISDIQCQGPEIFAKDAKISHKLKVDVTMSNDDQDVEM